MIVTALVAADLLGEAGLLQPVEAQIGDGSVKFMSYTSIGIIPGEVRLSVINTEESAGNPFIVIPLLPGAPEELFD